MIFAQWRTIKAKIILGFSILTVMLIIVGSVGLYGIQRLSDNLAFITGPAWDTADGAMEGSIGIGAQMLAVAAIVSGKNYEDNLTAFNEAVDVADEAINRLIEAGLMASDQVETVTDAIEIHHSHTQALFGTYQDFDNKRNEFNVLVDEFVQLGEEMEEIGDGAFEEIESNPSALYRWQGDLDLRWAAADGGMESNIGLLMGLYHVSRLISKEGDAAESKKEILGAIEFQRAASNEMLSTGRFELIAGGNWGNRSYRSLYEEYFQSYEANLLALIAATEAYQASYDEYQQSAQNLLDILEIFEESGDATIEGQVSAIQSTKSNTFSLMISATVIGAVIAIVFTIVLVRLVINPIKEVMSRIKNIAQGDGDLTQRMEVHSQDEMGELAMEFNVFIDNVHVIVKQVSSNCADMASSMQEMLTITKAASEKVEVQRDQTDQIATAFNELSATSKEISNNTNNASDVANSANNMSNDAKKVVGGAIKTINILANEIEEASTVISSLEKDVTKIVSVLTVIQGIAEQTNLLALNAAIEAARAGEQGRGFAVVADEVRSLASKTQDSTEEIRAMIERLQSGSIQAVQVMAKSKTRGQETVLQSENVSESLGNMSTLIAQINDLNTQVASASEEQTAVSEEMNHSVQNVVALANEVNSRISESSLMCEDLVSKTNQLSELVNKFKV